MKLKNYSIIVVLLLLAACAGVRPIPEISASLMEDTVLKFKSEDEPLKSLFTHNSELISVTGSGKISRYNPSTQMINDLYNLNIPISQQILSDKDHLLMKTRESDTLILFDLKAMKMVRKMQELPSDRLIGMQNGILCYIKGNKLFIHDVEQGKTLATIKRSEKERFFNMARRENGDVLVLSDQHLYIYTPGSDKIEQAPMSDTSTSPFLLDGDDMYYGGAQRDLIRFSLTERKNRWKFRIADYLRIQPLKAGNFIILIPQDNNIYFFTPQGTQHWWEKLNSTRDAAPLVMKDNVAVALWNKTVKFFNFKKKQVVEYPLERKVLSNMTASGDDVFFLSHEELEKNTDTPQFREIVKIGNNYGAEVISDPPDIIPSGKSVKMRISFINIQKPIALVTISDDNGKILFKEKFTDDQTISFVWIPAKAATYKLVVAVDGKNRQGLRVEQNLNVINLEQKLLEYFYRLQQDDAGDEITRHDLSDGDGF